VAILVAPRGKSLQITDLVRRLFKVGHADRSNPFYSRTMMQ